MDKSFVYNFINQRRLAVLSTITNEQKPEAALIGIAVTTDLELIFDTITTSRKYQNLLKNPNVALVIGWDNEITLQYEGKAILLKSREDNYLKEIYFEAFEGGRERANEWKDIVHFKVTPTWIRYSDFNGATLIEEIKAPF